MVLDLASDTELEGVHDILFGENRTAASLYGARQRVSGHQGWLYETKGCCMSRR